MTNNNLEFKAYVGRTKGKITSEDRANILTILNKFGDPCPSIQDTVDCHPGYVFVKAMVGRDFQELGHALSGYAVIPIPRVKEAYERPEGIAAIMQEGERFARTEATARQTQGRRTQ